VKTSNTRETLSSFLDLCGIDSDIFHARQVAAFRMFTLRESCIQIHEWYASRERQNAAIFVGFFSTGTWSPGYAYYGTYSELRLGSKDIQRTTEPLCDHGFGFYRAG
jgi:hypothetical protein